MENDYFLNSGIQPPLRFGATPIPTWQSRSQAPEMSFRSDQSLDCLINQNWDNFDSGLISMASSTGPSNNSFAIPELIGKLSNICNSSGEITPQSHPLLAATAAFIGGGNATLTPHFMKGNLPSSGNSTAMNSSHPAMTADPGFAERAAKFSSFGSRSFNGRSTTTTQLGLKMKNTESPCYRSNPLMVNANLPRVSSTPSLIASSGCPMASLGNLNCTQTQMQIMPKNGTEFQFPSPNEESSVLEQKQNSPSNSNSKKRKPNSRGKSPTQKCNSTKVAEAEEDEPNTKRLKPSEANEAEKLNTMEESKKEDDQKPEPPKDYIHVRARRGQATDSHSLAERVRREKISERMKLLQDLVPGCNKVTGKALMLDEIINYVQSLQRQVEFLSMKVASVNTRSDFNMVGVFSKDVFQGSGISAPSSYLLDSSMSSLFGQHRTHEIPQVQNNMADKIIGLQLPPTDEYSQGLPQFPTLCEDDLQSIVQMGFSQNQNQNQNQNQDSGFHQEGYPGTSQTSHMKVEL